ncbi:sugar isomerase domain-containing protein [Streptomyces ipomoeae]|uniref:Sugar isomerase domain-containing protein n=1 Tax=Streptomyces ipomoeae TaxID=103232 RepID=A0AAE8W690_9ACTN|nr:sugar isomerase domain-containing protein [Streptomyces ipomoeae]TQE35708.1 sugar isomerase domain-containing protein [Streptomyces ipomoeae]
MHEVVQSTSGECQVSDESANESVTEPVNAERFAREGLTALRHLTESARTDVTRAAELIADCVRADGVVQAFGTGHSQALVLELAGRAGGLVPTNRLSIADLVLYGGDHPSALDDPLLERKPGIAARLYDLAAPRPQDLFVVISNSGVNNVIVEMALHVKEHGHRLLAITSLSHTRAVPAGHPSGKKLADLADVVLDNAAPRGDALLELPGGGAVCALSTLTGVLLVQMAVAEATGRLLASGDRPPVYVSANVPGGFESNLELERRYAGRIRRTAG